MKSLKNPKFKSIYLFNLLISLNLLISAFSTISAQEVSQEELKRASDIRGKLIEDGFLLPANKLSLPELNERFLLEDAWYTRKKLSSATFSSRASHFSPDGLRFYILGRGERNIVEYRLDVLCEIMVFEVRDLWPDTAIEMGFVNSRILKKMMYAFEKFCYDQSDLIVTLSPGSRDNINQRYQNDYNSISVTNSANVDLFQKKDGQSISAFGIKKHQYAVYTGNIGEVNNSKPLFKNSPCSERERNFWFKNCSCGRWTAKRGVIKTCKPTGLE